MRKYYNVYEADVTGFSATPAGSVFGYIGFCYGGQFTDTNLGPDFSITPPIAQNPFVGAGIASVAVTAPGTYTTVPSVTAVGSSTISPTLAAVLQVQGTPTVGSGGSGYAIGDTVLFSNNVGLCRRHPIRQALWRLGDQSALPSPTQANIFSGSTPTNPVAQISSSGAGTGATANLVWGVGLVVDKLRWEQGFFPPQHIALSSGSATAVANPRPNLQWQPDRPELFPTTIGAWRPHLAHPKPFTCPNPGHTITSPSNQLPSQRLDLRHACLWGP